VHPIENRGAGRAIEAGNQERDIVTAGEAAEDLVEVNFRAAR